MTTETTMASLARAPVASIQARHGPAEGQRQGFEQAPERAAVRAEQAREQRAVEPRVRKDRRGRRAGFPPSARRRATRP